MADRYVLVVADSLAFHGPTSAELSTHPGLYPNVIGRELGARVDLVARLGWTARDAWWAMCKDPVVYSVLLPRAAAVVLAVGGGDHLPASIPTYLRDGIAYLRPGWLRRGARRDGIAYLRPGWLRRGARRAYRRCHPHVVRATGGRMRVLPQRATDSYLTRCVQGIRHVRPGVPVVGIVPPPYDSRHHGNVTRPHEPAVRAAHRWGSRCGVPLVDADRLATPYLAADRLNPDGMHWPWELHAEVGAEFAAAIRECWRTMEPPPGG